MRGGGLRAKIIIYQRTDVRNTDYGSTEETYSEFLTTRADVKFMSGAEVLQNETIANVSVVTFIIRYRTGILETMEVEYDSDRYNIKVIEENQRKTMIKMTCQKIVN